VNDYNHKFDPLTADELAAAEACTAAIDAESKSDPIIPPDDAPAPNWLRVLRREPDEHWEYRDENGKTAFYAARLNKGERDGKKLKDVVPISWFEGKGWGWGNRSQDRLLYNLDRIVAGPTASIVVVEGEKTAAAVAQVFSKSVVTTSSGGSGAPSKTDWTPRAGRAVLICPDDDEPGQKYAAALISILAPIARSISVVDIAALRAQVDRDAKPDDGWDIADALARGVDANELRKAAINLAKSVELNGHAIDEMSSTIGAPSSRPNEQLNTLHTGWPIPDLTILDDGVSPPDLPDEALPDGWGEWIKEEAASLGCPEDYVAASLIASAGAWVGNARRVAATEKWIEPLHTWMAMVGPPSIGKTPALEAVKRASKELEQDAKPEFEREIREHAAEVEVAAIKEAEWKKAVQEAVKSGQSPPERPDDAVAPPAPLPPRIFVQDATLEELQMIQSRNPRGVMYSRDELAGWVGSFDRYGGNGGDRAYFLEAWNGGSYDVHRKSHSGKPVEIPFTGVSILGGWQPDKLREAISGSDDGLASRFGYIYPESVPVADLSRNDSGRDRYEILLKAARLLRGLKCGSGFNGEPAPISLWLDDTAFKLFNAFQKEFKNRDRTRRAPVSGWYGKSAARALRLAGVFELLAWAVGGGKEPDLISGAAMARACDYTEYLSGMFDRVAAEMVRDGNESDAALIAKHIQKTTPAILNERELYRQPGWAWLRKKNRRDPAFSALSDAGWIQRPPSPGGVKPRGDWAVSPRILERYNHE
jgi:hypothetical protein